jgi:hypothetical protein
MDALAKADAALAKAEAAVTLALSALGQEAPPPVTRLEVGARTTSTQVMTILARAGGPLTLVDIADGVVAIRRGKDTPKRRGGTRYQELCRTALTRLIDRGVVERVPPADNRGMMRFQRIAAKSSAA